MPPRRRGRIEGTIHETTKLAEKTAGIAGLIMLFLVVFVVLGSFYFGISNLLSLLYNPPVLLIVVVAMVTVVILLLLTLRNGGDDAE